MCVFFSLSNNMLPYKRVCDKEDLVNSSNVQSVLFKVLRKKWRRKCEVDPISKPQPQIGFKQS